jgi:hypothetical protein
MPCQPNELHLPWKTDSYKLYIFCPLFESEFESRLDHVLCWTRHLTRLAFLDRGVSMGTRNNWGGSLRWTSIQREQRGSKATSRLMLQKWDKIRLWWAIIALAKIQAAATVICCYCYQHKSCIQSLTSEEYTKQTTNIQTELRNQTKQKTCRNLTVRKYQTYPAPTDPCVTSKYSIFNDHPIPR